MSKIAEIKDAAEKHILDLAAEIAKLRRALLEIERTGGRYDVMTLRGIARRALEDRENP